MNKSHTEYGPKKLLEPTPDETPTSSLFMTHNEEHELGLIGNRLDFREQIKKALSGYLVVREFSCGDLAGKLNRDGLKTADGGHWNARLVMLFTRRFMKARPPL